MASRLSIRSYPGWSKSGGLIVAVLLMLGLTSAISAAQNSGNHIILPDPKLIGCKASTCSHVMPDPITDSHAVYPRKVLVDISEGGIIGLIALYDPSTSIDVIKASIDDRYGKWAAADFKTGPIMFWRIEPERLVISLSKDDTKGIPVIYLAFGAEHPVPPAPRANFGRFVSATLVTLRLTSPAAPNPGEHMILPDSKLIGCKASTCSEVMPDPIADSHAIYPWQVSVEITDGAISGLTALYDPSISIDAVKASIDDRYGKWAVHGFGRGRAKTWRIEPGKFVVSLAPADKMYDGMSSVSYLAFGAQHPVPVAAQGCSK
jgi:hypothetical protein